MDAQDFQWRCYHVMESDLTTLEKMVMIAKYMYEGNPTKMASGTGLHPQMVERLELELVRKDWLVLSD